MKYSGAIFDLDGTLLDSMGIWDTIAEDYLRSLGIAPRENLTETFRHMSMEQAAEYYKRVYGVAGTVEEIVTGVNHMIARFYTDEVQLKKGAASFVKNLAASDVKMCVATTTDRRLTEAALKRNGLSGYFGRIFTCAGVGHGKDEPFIWETARAYMGTAKKETLVFEDALHAARTAASAGFPVCAVYDSSEPGQEELRRLADYFIEDFTQAGEVIA